MKLTILICSAVKAEIANAVPGVDFKREFNYLVNGLSLECRRADLGAIKAIEGLQAADEIPSYNPSMTTAVDLTTVRSAWEQYKVKGEGMVIAVIDTGVQADHECMKISAGVNKRFTDEASANAEFESLNLRGRRVNEKIPYAYNYSDCSLRTDVEGREGGRAHGLHCAGIIAGNNPDRMILVKEKGPDGQEVQKQKITRLKRATS